jgi:hypothetical protein
MLNKYNDFIVENKLVGLLLEGEIKGSADFLLRLDNIKNRSEIAEIIYDLFNDEPYLDTDLSQNWINVTDKDDTVSFLSDKKFDQIDDPEEESPYGIKGRSEIKIGRFVRALLSNKKVIEYVSQEMKFKDKDYEDFVNLYKSSNTKSLSEFELVNGEKIKDYYNESNYARPDSGQLGHSCMKHESCQDYFGIYTDNEDVCSLLVLKEDDEVLGRAIVWKLTKSPCESVYFMDRIYTSIDSDVIKFNNFSDERGWVRKYKNNCDNLDSYYFIYKGKIIMGEASVKLKKVEFDEYPFVDTLTQLVKKTKTISNIGTSACEFMSDTGGGLDPCYECDGEGEVEEKDCSSCNGEGQEECPECGGDGEFDEKECKECKGEGVIECSYCHGKGRFESGPCPDCAGSLERDIKDIIRNNKNSELTKLAKEFWDKRKNESPEKKEKKKKKKDSN